MWLLWAVIARVEGSAEDRAADRAAVGRMAAGEAEALGELYDRHARGVYSLALRILQHPADAEDVVQEVFSQAWRQASRYDAARGVVAAWLLTLARSRAIDRLRARRTHVERSIEGAGGFADVAPLPDTEMLSVEQVALVRAALDALPLLQRMAIELAYYEGLTHAEIAERLEQPLGTVKTRIRLALARLRDTLAASR
jgi:RNA polymerase sigma-70 factor (ECF subfamily)